MSREDWESDASITPYVTNRRRSAVDPNSTCGSGTLRRGRPNTISCGLPSPSARRSLDTSAPAQVVSTALREFISPEKGAVVLKGASTVDTSPIRGPDGPHAALKRQESTFSVGSLSQTDFEQAEHDKAFIWLDYNDQDEDEEENETTEDENKQAADAISVAVLDKETEGAPFARSISCSSTSPKADEKAKGRPGHCPSIASLDSGIDCQSAASVVISSVNSLHCAQDVPTPQAEPQNDTSHQMVDTCDGHTDAPMKQNFDLVANVRALSSDTDKAEASVPNPSDSSFVKEMASNWDAMAGVPDGAKVRDSALRFARSPLGRLTNVSPISLPRCFADSRHNTSLSQRRPQLPISTDLVHANSVQEAKRRLSQYSEEDEPVTSSFCTAMAGHTPARSSHSMSLSAMVQPVSVGSFFGGAPGKVEYKPETPKIKPALLTPASMKQRKKSSRCAASGPLKPVKRLQRGSPKSPHKGNSSIRSLGEKGRLSPLPNHLQDEFQF